MENLKVITNRHLEKDPHSGIIAPINKGTVLAMNPEEWQMSDTEQAYLRLPATGKGLMLPYTHFNIPYNGNHYSVFLTESNGEGLILYAASNLNDRMEILTAIQNKDHVFANTDILKIRINKATLEMQPMLLSEIEPLF